MKFADIGIKGLSLEISTNCNIRCTFCPIDQRSAPTTFLSLEQVTHVLDQLAEDGSLEFVGFQFLNEPFLHPKIEEILGYAHKVGLKSYLSTNGTILTDRLVDLLARTSPTRLKISVQDVNPATFNIVKGTKMSLDEFKKRVANLIRRRLFDDHFRTKIELDVAVPLWRNRSLLKKRSRWIDRIVGIYYADRTINDANEELLKHIINFLKYLEIEIPASIEWDTFVPDLSNTKTWRSDYVPTARLGPGVTLELKAFYDWIGIDQRLPVTYGACPRLEHVVINYRGDFQLCCQDTHGKTAIGNVFRQPLREILSNPEGLAKLLRAPGYELPTEHCRKCQGAATRRGVTLLNINNRFQKGKPKFVPEHRRNALKALRAVRAFEVANDSVPVIAVIDESLARPVQHPKEVLSILP